MKKTLTTLVLLAATAGFTAKAQDRTAPAPQERKPVQQETRTAPPAQDRTARPVQQTRTPAPVAAPVQERSRGTQDTEIRQQRAMEAERARASEPAQGGDRISRLTQELGLSPDQERRMRAAKAKQDADMEQLRGTAGLDRTQQAERSDGIQTEHDRELRSILSAEQYEKYQESIRPRRVEGTPQQLRERPAPTNE